MGADKRTAGDGAGRGILVIGDIRRVFRDAQEVADKGCKFCPTVLDGIDMAAKHSFTAIAVVMAGTSARLGSVLKVLRGNCEGRIILLARMHEEPRAIQLVGESLNGASSADGYLICPVSFSELVSSVSHPRGGEFETGGGALGAGYGVAETVSAGSTPAAMEKKIRLLEKLATEDDLTGLKNRRYIWEFSRQVIDRAKVENGRMTLLVFDIDDFKHYNDVYGHCAGDKVLKQAAVLMRRCCRRQDVVGRVGGDEFAVVFWDDPRRRAAGAEPERRLATADHPRQAIIIAKRFVRELEKAEFHLLGPGGKGVLTISGGLASYPRDGSTIEELFGQADKALLEAKRSGKNRIYLVGGPRGDIADIE
ncbi:MAG: GGDEF domain-containing protein [Phycisphaerales bacterium]|nr:MAG: GGDEF domain-containing protein [Phycisphaerales bacterium]